MVCQWTSVVLPQASHGISRLHILQYLINQSTSHRTQQRPQTRIITEFNKTTQENNNGLKGERDYYLGGTATISFLVTYSVS